MWAEIPFDVLERRLIAIAFRFSFPAGGEVAAQDLARGIGFTYTSPHTTLLGVLPDTLSEVTALQGRPDQSACGAFVFCPVARWALGADGRRQGIEKFTPLWARAMWKGCETLHPNRPDLARHARIVNAQKPTVNQAIRQFQLMFLPTVAPDVAGSIPVTHPK
jgi:hypothetical protein